MSDRVAKRGRPRRPEKPKLTCLRKARQVNEGGYMCDNTVWHINVDYIPEKKTKEVKNELRVDLMRKIKNIPESNANQPKSAQPTKIEDEKALWKLYNDIRLTNGDKNSIIGNKWLNDSVVNTAQFLLKQKYPTIAGLQNVLLCQIDSNKQYDWNQLFKDQNEMKSLKEKRLEAAKKLEVLIPERDTVGTEEEQIKVEKDFEENDRIMKDCELKLSKLRRNVLQVEGLQPLPKGSKFVQILFDKTSNRSHWVCVSNVKTKNLKTVRIYDSDLERIDNSIKNYCIRFHNAIKRMYYDCEDIKLELPLVAQCSDGCSGGAYAIAFAQALCAGEDPAQILFCHRPKQMRIHLMMCLEKGFIDRFPTGRDIKLTNYLVDKKEKTN